MKPIAALLILALATAVPGHAQSNKSKELPADLKPGPGTSQAVDPPRSTATPAGGGNVRVVQEALKAKGHDPGPIDGRLGAKTTAALRDFQKKEGLPASGRLDGQTLGRLGLGSDTATASASPGSGSSDRKPQKTEAKKEGPGASTTTPQAEQAKATDATKKQR
jgi:peptidoglycan hydrolase-like protein with peptidoglycan-binding domain